MKVGILYRLGVPYCIQRNPGVLQEVFPAMAILQADASLRITNVDLLLKRGRLGEFIDPQPTNDHTHEVTRCASPTHILSRCPIAEPAECLVCPYLCR